MLYTYLEVGLAKGLVGDTLSRYVTYMIERWADTEAEKCKDGYAVEWAERFAAGIEAECSDEVGKRILQKIDWEG